MGNCHDQEDYRQDDNCDDSLVLDVSPCCSILSSNLSGTPQVNNRDDTACNARNDRDQDLSDVREDHDMVCN